MKLIATVVIEAADAPLNCRHVFCTVQLHEGEQGLLVVDGRGGLSVHCLRHNELPQEDPR